MSDQAISPLQLQAVREFFERLYGTYPHLFIDENQQFFQGILARLESKPEHMSFHNMLDVQQLIFKNMEAKNADGWYQTFHAVYVYSIRTSAFAKQLLAMQLAEMQMMTGQHQFERVLAPGCGKFYEASTVCSQFGVQSLDACDIDRGDLEVSRSATPVHAPVSWCYRDLTQPLEHSYDLALFFHPQVCDYDKLWEAPVYKRYGEEFKVPAEELHRSSTFKFIPSAWQAILGNCLGAVKDGGHAAFICYEHRELAIIQSYLANKPQFEILWADANNLIVDPAFSADMLQCLATEHQPSAEFVAMGAYRAAMVIRKNQKIKSS